MSLLASIPNDPVIDRFIDLSYEISEKIIRFLQNNGQTQRELAKKLGKKDSEISKWLMGNHNFTLRTIAAIELAIGEKLVDVEMEPSYTVPVNQAAAFYLTEPEFVLIGSNSGVFDVDLSGKLGGSLVEYNIDYKYQVEV